MAQNNRKNPFRAVMVRYIYYITRQVWRTQTFSFIYTSYYYYIDIIVPHMTGMGLLQRGISVF